VATSIEQIDTFFDHLESTLHPINHGVSVDLKIMVEEVINIEAAHAANPETKALMLNDANEFCDELNARVLEYVKTMDETQKKDLAQKLAKLLEHAKDLGDGLFQFLSNIFKGIPLEQFLPQKVEKKTEDPELSFQHRYPFKLPDLLCTSGDIKTFLTACGLEIKPCNGGSHSRTSDPLKEMHDNETLSNGDKMWLIKIVKTLYDKGLSLERIKRACDELKIKIKLKT